MSMLKKMLVAVAVIAMAIPAFAAVESIKVGGDITTYGIGRYNFDWSDGHDHFLQTSTRVYVNAALTDNVEAMVRLINERMWDRNFNGEDTNSINLDLAYIKVSDLGIAGLDLTVGRQEIQFGEGLVVGSAYVPGYSYPNGNTWIVAEDLGLQRAFDAIRVDYKGTAPVDVTAFMAKIIEKVDTNRDRNLYGVNVGFDIQDTARLEGYYVRYQLMSTDNFSLGTIGLRATGDVAGLGLKGEFAKQLGKWYPGGRDNEGWALLLGGEYNFDAAVSGNIHANLNLFSGYDGSGDNTEWITRFPYNTGSRIGPINYVLITDWAIEMLNNARVINVGAAVNPVEKICINFDWWNVNLMEEAWAGDDKTIGNEIAAGITYNYTEDLCFGLQYGVLLTGDALGMFDNDPWQLIASMKVAF